MLFEDVANVFAAAMKMKVLLTQSGVSASVSPCYKHNYALLHCIVIGEFRIMPNIMMYVYSCRFVGTKIVLNLGTCFCGLCIVSCY
jgi:hypothetical protein